jgi:plasmid stability protein
MRNRVVRLVLGLAAIGLLGWAMLYSGRVAVARGLTKYAGTILTSAPADALATIDSGVAMTPRDAEIHYTRGIVANQINEPATALREFEQAVSLRPRDYSIWIELGLVRDQLGDQTGALAAFNESIRLAPNYAQPRWKRGHLLFRMGKYDEAFADLRQATNSNAELLPGFIDLAWGASRKDPNLTEQLVQAKDDNTQSQLALFFARHGKPDEAVARFKLVGVVSSEERRKLVKELLSAGAARQAFEVWSTNSGQLAASRELIYDGGFEGPLNLDESGFGWRLATGQPGVNFSVDGGQPQSGSRSLRVTLSGHANPAAALVSQLALVEPGARYKLSCAVRTTNIVTGGPLVMVVNDSVGQPTLARSAQLPANSGGWQPLSLEFVSGTGTTAIVFSLQRELCTSDPCPIFGSVNLDSFSLVRVNAEAVK